MGNQTSKNNDTYDYNENEGKFTKKNQTIIDLLTGGREILYERDLTINNINKLKEESNKTTLGKSDIDLLYQLSMVEFNTNYDRLNFENIKLKDMFPNMNPDKLMIQLLMPTAKSFDDAIKKGEKPVVEHFADEGFQQCKLQSKLQGKLQHNKPSYFATVSRISLVLLCIILFTLVVAILIRQ